MEKFREQPSLSPEQQEKLSALAELILPLVDQLRQTNDSHISDQIMDEIDEFKEALKKEQIGIPDENVDDFVNDLINAKAA